MVRRVRILPLACLGAALSGSALAQDSGHAAARERGGADASRSSPGSWADEVRSAIGGGRSGKSGDGSQIGHEAPIRSDMQTGSTGKGSAPGKPETR